MPEKINSIGNIGNIIMAGLGGGAVGLTLGAFLVGNSMSNREISGEVINRELVPPGITAESPVQQGFNRMFKYVVRIEDGDLVYGAIYANPLDRFPNVGERVNVVIDKRGMFMYDPNAPNNEYERILEIQRR